MAPVRVGSLEASLGFLHCIWRKRVHPVHCLVDLVPHLVWHIHLVLFELLHVLGVEAEGNHLVGVRAKSRWNERILL